MNESRVGVYKVNEARVGVYEVSGEKVWLEAGISGEKV